MGVGSDDSYVDPDFQISEKASDSNEENGSEELSVDCDKTIDANSQPRCRKRKRNMQNWKRNKAKRLRNTGQSYININGVGSALRLLGP